MTRLKNKWWFDRNECSNSDAQNAQNELSLSNVAGIFFILIVGLVVALIVALFEFCFSRRKASKEEAAELAATGGGSVGGIGGSSIGGSMHHLHHHQKSAPALSTATLKSKADLSLQGGCTEYDNGRGGGVSRLRFLSCREFDKNLGKHVNPTLISIGLTLSKLSTPPSPYPLHSMFTSSSSFPLDTLLATV